VQTDLWEGFASVGFELELAVDECGWAVVNEGLMSSASLKVGSQD